MSGEQPVHTSSTGEIPGTTYGGPGTSAVIDIHTAVSNQQQCAQGWHAWVPWLQLDNGSFVTWCTREGCDHKEQWDA